MLALSALVWMVLLVAMLNPAWLPFVGLERPGRYTFKIEGSCLVVQKIGYSNGIKGY